MQILLRYNDSQLESYFPFELHENLSTALFNTDGMKWYTLLVRETFMCFEIICIEHISSNSILLKSFKINDMVHCSSQPISLEVLAIIRLVHIWIENVLNV